MKKILLLTKNNPIEVYDVMIKLYHVLDHNKVLVFSPQYTAMLAAEQKKISYRDVFYPALHTWEEHKELVLKEHSFKVVVVVGTVDKTTSAWYDAIIGLKNDNMDDYEGFDEEFNPYKIEYFKEEDGEIQFDSLPEIQTFIEHIVAIEDKENPDDEDELQFTTTSSDRVC